MLWIRVKIQLGFIKYIITSEIYFLNIRYKTCIFKITNLSLNKSDFKLHFHLYKKALKSYILLKYTLKSQIILKYA